jgi:aminoglycoside 6'-N-acetyltransferase I
MIRSFAKGDTEVWAAFRARLWPDADPQELALECRAFADGIPVPDITAVLIAEDEASHPIGFLELSIRASAPGCASMPIAYVEAWYVEPHARRQGVGVALMRAADNWARSRGFVELASDTDVGNEASQCAHARCDFQEVESTSGAHRRFIQFRKSL